MADVAAPHFDLETLAECPLCGATGHKLFARSTDLLHGVTDSMFDYVTCNDCGVFYERTRPTAGTMSVFYTTDYGPYISKSGLSSELKKQLKTTSISRKLAKTAMKLANWHLGLPAVESRIRALHSSMLKENRVFLDFGCGGGKRLDSYRKTYRCKTIGMDFNETVLQQIRSRGHVALTSDKAGWSKVQSASVDLVVMSHVIEHLHDPAEALLEVLRVLKPGGLVDVSTPNPLGISATTFIGSWYGLQAPTHTMLFPPDVLVRLLEKTGFSGTEILGEPVSKDYLRSAAQAASGSFTAPPLTSVREVARIAHTIRQASKQGAFDRYHVFARKPA